MKGDLKKIWAEERGILVLMTLMTIVAIIFLVYSLVGIANAGTVVRVSYGDIGGYQEGNARELMAFPMLAAIIGVLHNFLAVKIFKKNGSAMAKVFLFASILIMLGGMVVLTRLLGEG